MSKFDAWAYLDNKKKDEEKRRVFEPMYHNEDEI